MRVVTGEMMEHFEAIGSIAEPPAREDALGVALGIRASGTARERSARPEFRELSDLLKCGLPHRTRSSNGLSRRLPSPIVRPLFWFGLARREWFRASS
ncbi:MAG: hypothetical protein U0166_15735 [Acidobacteriota bacterium]